MPGTGCRHGSDKTKAGSRGFRRGRIQMPERWRVLLLTFAILGMVATAIPVYAGVPDVSFSFYVPQTGTVASPAEGSTAFRNFRACPNNGATDPLVLTNARVKV